MNPNSLALLRLGGLYEYNGFHGGARNIWDTPGIGNGKRLGVVLVNELVCVLEVDRDSHAYQSIRVLTKNCIGWLVHAPDIDEFGFELIEKPTHEEA